jgi:hypothetical protein
MTRNHNNETLIPIDAVVAQSGLAAEWVWGHLDEREVERDWDDSYAVRWSVAKRLAAAARQATEENDKLNVKMREEQEAQIEAEVEEGRRQAAARAAADGRRLVQGVEVSVPGDPHPPEWMKGGE